MKGDLGLLMAIAVAGGVGSVARHLADQALPARVRARYPWGTMLVNLTGSFALGLVTGWATSPGPWQTVVGTGLIGGYTTFSTASLQTVHLLTSRRLGAAAVNGLGMLVACVLLAAAGIAIAGA